MLRLGLLGAGGIAGEVAKAVAGGSLAGVQIVAVAASSLDSARARAVAERVGAPVVEATALAGHEPDWVLEAAGRGATLEHVPALLAADVDVILMSIGALLDDTFERSVEGQRARGRRLITPSGGIGGLDAVRALHANGGLREASITSTKAPRGLAGAPYFDTHGIVLPEDRRTVVFEGSARQAIVGFPANVNVAAALSLAGIGPDRTVVRIISDPAATSTQHQIRALGDAAEVTVTIVSRPHPDNPRTSFLAALSAIDAVRGVALES